MEDLRYPIGRFSRPADVTPGLRTSWIEELRRQPARLREAIAGLDDEQLDTRYRPDGWTVRQVVHHVADSHLNAYVRCKWTLTEDHPVIKIYEEKDWAETPEARRLDPGVSLDVLDALHRRWTALLEALDEAAWARTLEHPETGVWTLEELTSLYVWHGRHHAAHVQGLRRRQGW